MKVTKLRNGYRIRANASDFQALSYLTTIGKQAIEAKFIPPDHASLPQLSRMAVHALRVFLREKGDILEATEIKPPLLASVETVAAE